MWKYWGNIFEGFRRILVFIFQNKSLLSNSHLQKDLKKKSPKFLSQSTYHLFFHSSLVLLDHKILDWETWNRTSSEMKEIKASSTMFMGKFI